MRGTSSFAEEGEPKESSLATRLAESGKLPDPLLRLTIRRMCAQRLRDERKGGAEAVFARQQAWLEGLRSDTAAVQPIAGGGRSQQELPQEFFRLCLGKHLKYTACCWDDITRDLTQAEEKTLRLYCERAELHDGLSILDLGCGWGSLTLWMAERYPQAKITAVCTSRLHKQYIEERCRERALFNVLVVHGDIRRMALAEGAFDRVLAVEMFEHMGNYRQVMSRIAGWLAPAGKLFVQLFCHRELLYLFEGQGVDQWMGRHFFTGGVMPSADTLMALQDHLQVQERWLLPGTHYEKTANAWLANLERNREKVMAVLRQTYGVHDAGVWYQRLRLFWMSCAGLFGFANGSEWMVAHYVFRK
ncbi:MAG: class I SAM-dependent methyltransferase [Pseudoxanthomonas sp.]